MEIIDLCRKIIESQPEELEKQLGSSLPEDYRNFLLEHNVAKVRPNLFWIAAEDEENVVRYFMGFCPETKWYDLNYVRSMYEGRVLSTLLPIAIDEDSSVVCISLKSEDYGKIYFWDRHQEIFGELGYYNVHWLADNFTDFLSKLYHRTSPR